MAMNYNEQGGEKTVIGGELDIQGTLKLNGAQLQQVANQADSTATTIAELKTDFNGLLAKLKAAGMMAADAAE